MKKGLKEARRKFEANNVCINDAEGDFSEGRKIPVSSQAIMYICVLIRVK